MCDNSTRNDHIVVENLLLCHRPGFSCLSKFPLDNATRHPSISTSYLDLSLRLGTLILLACVLTVIPAKIPNLTGIIYVTVLCGSSWYCFGRVELLDVTIAWFLQSEQNCGFDISANSPRQSNTSWAAMVRFLCWIIVLSISHVTYPNTYNSLTKHDISFVYMTPDWEL